MSVSMREGLGRKFQSRRQVGHGLRQLGPRRPQRIGGSLHNDFAFGAGGPHRALDQSGQSCRVTGPRRPDHDARAGRQVFKPVAILARGHKIRAPLNLLVQKVELDETASQGLLRRASDRRIEVFINVDVEAKRRVSRSGSNGQSDFKSRRGPPDKFECRRSPRPDARPAHLSSMERSRFRQGWTGASH